ncbi:MAG: HlyC/CorC family transporter [Deltaproteobacteria bacterium]|nr:HlyC/CorC family transporter [Deltaproteobacteria bacterium]
MDNYITVILILLCLCLESLYSGGEIAFISSDINRIRSKAKAGLRSAGLAVKLLESPEWFLATTLTGTNLFIVTGTTLMTALCLSLFGSSRGEMISMLVMIPTLLMMIISRNIFQRHSEILAIKISYFIWYSSLLFYPVVYLIAKISKKTLRMSMGESGRSYSYVTKDGLKYILEEQGVDSDIMSMEKNMVRNIIDFSEVTVGNIMVPLSTMAVLPVTATLREAAQLTAEKKYLRIPVYRDQVFNIVGILHYFDLLDVMQGSPSDSRSIAEDRTVESCLRPVGFYVPETKLAKELLIELQIRGERMAVVVDEYGGAVGIVTIEDILEEIVGEIDDEYDSGEKLYKKIGPGKYLFNARISIERVKQTIPVEIPEGDYETLGGFLLYTMGKIPKRKEAVRYENVLFVIEDADMKSIREVLVELQSVDVEGASGGEHK